THFMTVLLSLFGLMFVGSFILDYQRGKTFRQSLFGGVDTMKRNLFIFLRTSLSMMIFYRTAPTHLHVRLFRTRVV
ncbi:hypothetical protein, partial [Bacillus sp. P14.5]|uniref:hypothetical protein n=1 Tax=Bacillus sp. P14.5 TaxID=1983400 RepID=UPI0013B05245